MIVFLLMAGVQLVSSQSTSIEALLENFQRMLSGSTSYTDGIFPDNVHDTCTTDNRISVGGVCRAREGYLTGKSTEDDCFNSSRTNWARFELPTPEDFEAASDDSLSWFLPRVLSGTTEFAPDGQAFQRVYQTRTLQGADSDTLDPPLAPDGIGMTAENIRSDPADHLPLWADPAANNIIICDASLNNFDPADAEDPTSDETRETVLRALTQCPASWTCKRLPKIVSECTNTTGADFDCTSDVLHEDIREVYRAETYGLNEGAPPDLLSIRELHGETPTFGRSATGKSPKRRDFFPELDTRLNLTEWTWPAGLSPTDSLPDIGVCVQPEMHLLDPVCGDEIIARINWRTLINATIAGGTLDDDDLDFPPFDEGVIRDFLAGYMEQGEVDGAFPLQSSDGPASWRTGGPAPCRRSTVCSV